MTSGAALDGPAVREKDQENDSVEKQMHCLSEGAADQLSYDVRAEHNLKTWVVGGNCRKRQLPVSTPTSRMKKMRTPVQCSQTPQITLPSLSSTPWPNRTQKITPTVSGIQEVASHLLRTKGRSGSQDGSHSIVALPTECTYEACTLLSWGKEELLSEEENTIREEQLERLKLVSSTSSVHVYLQHHNIQQMDQLLDFPKKAYATRQNPKVCCSLNEARLVFQKLADQFWPGPVHLYLPPQSFSPVGLIQTNFLKFKFIGFRCPSHPLAVRVLKQVHQDASEPAVLVGSPIAHNMATLLRAKDVTCKLAESETLHMDSKVEVLHGEERREIFTVPTCEFRDEWLECWIVPEKRSIVLKGKSSRDVIPQLKEVLRNTTGNNRIISAVLQHWKVADFREK